jgi:sec-independent protein translocase protein TatA
MIRGFPTVGGTELLIFLAVILLFFGAKRIPDLARSLGRGTHEFRKGIVEGATEEEDRAQNGQEKPTLDESDEMPQAESEATHAGQKG